VNFSRLLNAWCTQYHLKYAESIEYRFAVLEMDWVLPGLKFWTEWKMLSKDRIKNGGTRDQGPDQKSSDIRRRETPRTLHMVDVMWHQCFTPRFPVIVLAYCWYDIDVGTSSAIFEVGGKFQRIGFPRNFLDEDYELPFLYTIIFSIGWQQLFLLITSWIMTHAP